MSRFPSLGQIAALSLELDQFVDGRPMRFDRQRRRIGQVSRLRDLCIPYPVTVTLIGTSVSCPDLIPAGTCLLGGVTTRNLTAVGGASGYQLGILNAPDDFGIAIPGTADYESDIRDWNARNPAYYPEAATVVLTAIGGIFSFGQVKVTAWGLPH